MTGFDEERVTYEKQKENWKYNVRSFRVPAAVLSSGGSSGLRVNDRLRRTADITKIGRETRSCKKKLVIIDERKTDLSRSTPIYEVWRKTI